MAFNAQEDGKPQVEHLQNHDHGASTAEDKQHEVDDDPHAAAESIVAPESISRTTIYAIFFLGLSVVSPISCGQLMAGAILNDIARSLNGAATDVNWILSGWAIAATVSVTAMGKLSDIFGRRWMILAGNAFCLLGSIVAASAQSLATVIVGSTLIGFGFGFVLLVFTCVPELCRFKYRGVGLAWVEFCLFVPWGVAAALLANLLYEHASWRWIYYISIIYSAVTLAGLTAFYFPPSRTKYLEDKTRWQAFKQLDFIGLGMITAGLPICLLGLSWAGSPDHPWKGSSVIAPIVIGGVLIIGAFVYDLKIAGDANAFFPPRLFYRFREYTAHLIVGLVTGMIYYTNAGLLPQANLYMFTNDPTEIGINLLPNGFGQFFGSTVIPGLLHLTKKPKVFIVLAVFLQTVFVGLYAWAVPDHRAGWIAFQFFGQGCFDWIVTCAVVNISLHVRQSDLGLAIGIFSAARNFGGSIGIAIFNTILNNSASAQVGPRISKAAIEAGFPRSRLDALIPAVVSNALGVPNALASVPGGVDSAVAVATLQAFREAYAYAYRRVFYSTIPFGVVSFLLALFIRDGGQYMTNQISVHLGKRQ